MLISLQSGANSVWRIFTSIIMIIHAVLNGTPDFLACFNCVSRAHGMGLYSSSVRSSSVSQSSLYSKSGFLSNISCCRVYGPGEQLILEFLKEKKNIVQFLRFFFFVFANIGLGAKIPKRDSSYKSRAQLNVFKLLLNFLLNGPHRTAFYLIFYFCFEI